MCTSCHNQSYKESLQNKSEDELREIASDLELDSAKTKENLIDGIVSFVSQ